MLRKKLSEILNSIADLERLLSKTATGKAVPRDIIQLKISLSKISEIKTFLVKFNSDAIKSISESLINLPDLILEVQKVLNENFISGIDNFGIINKG